jgi:site-specific DNA recombinase
LGNKGHQPHELTYAGGLAKCAHCGRPVTGEVIRKKMRTGSRSYVYYRCTRYNSDGHPRVRVKEADLDAQVLALFDRIKVQDEKVRDWFAQVLRAKAKGVQKINAEEQQRLQRELVRLRQQLDRLLSLRLLEEIDAETFAAKSAELRQETDRLKLRLEVNDRDQAEYADLTVKVFELSQRLREKWVTADCRAKRRLLEIVCLNYTLDGATLVPTMRKPFDVLAEGLSLCFGRGERT